MKKILFIIPSLETGGTVSSLSSIINNLQSHLSIDVFALSHDGNREVTFSDRLLKRSFLIHAYNCSLLLESSIIKYAILIIKVVKRICLILHLNIEKIIYQDFIKRQNRQYDYVVGFQEGSSTLFASYYKNVKKIAWIHCDYSKYHKQGKELQIYMGFDRIVCVSKYTGDKFKNIYPSLSNKVLSIHNLLDFQNIQQSSLVNIDDYRFQSNKFTIISVGRLHPVKRFEYIPDIAKALVDRGCDFRWYILGPVSSERVLSDLENAIEANFVSKFVYYLGNKNNPYPYMAESDLLVSLSSTEACPMIFNEARVLGVPILTTDFGSAFEFIDNGKNGIIVPFEKITSTLENLINSPAKVEALKGANDLVDFNNVIIDSVDQLFM